MTTLILDDNVASRLDRVAARLGEPAQTLAARALESWLEDQEDHAAAVEALAEIEETGTITMAEMKRRLGLVD